VLVSEKKVWEVREILKWTRLEDKIVTYKEWESRASKLSEINKKYGNVFFGLWWVMIPAAYLYSETQ
jgi:hypothetical protein